MDFRKLNEELEKFTEAKLFHGDKGFVASGTAGEVTDLINKLAQEYGDLTIPEFIDKLIEKEKNGEEILNETLNEGYEFKNSDIDYKNYTESRKWDIKDINTNYKNIAVEVSDAYTGGIGIKIKNIYSKEASDVLFVELKFEQKSAMTNEWLGILTVDINDNNSTPQNIERFLKTNTKVLGGVEWSRSTTYYCCFGRTLSRRTQSSNIEATAELIQGLNKLIQKLDDSLQISGSKYDDELIELEKARANANRNKNAANTTVKQALSKSSIAKKIQALQNPTPEQLAKILAAIEG